MYSNQSSSVNTILTSCDYHEIVDPLKVSVSPVAKLSYYMYCLNSAIPRLQLKLSESCIYLSEFSHWEAYSRYDTSEIRKQMLEITSVLHPKFFFDKGVFVQTDNQMLKNGKVQLVPVKSILNSTSLKVQDSIYIQGDQYDTANMVFLAADFLTEFYTEPIKSLKPTDSNSLPGLLLTPESTPRKDVPKLLNTSQDRLKSIDDRPPERDSKLWYSFLTILSIIITVFVCLSNISEGLRSEDGSAESRYTLWNVCVEPEGAGIGSGCDTYTSPADIGLGGDTLSQELTSARALIATYPVLACIVILSGILRAWNRNSRKHIGRFVRAFIAVFHFGYLLVTASILTRFFNNVEGELKGLNKGNSSYETSNGMGLLLPWAAWILSIFHTFVAIVWAIRAWVKRGNVVPL